MQLPSELQNRTFAEWNYLVKGLMQVWELAQMLGLDHCLNQLLSRDHHAALAERLGQIGNDRATMQRILLACCRALTPDTDPLILWTIKIHGSADEPSQLESIDLPGSDYSVNAVVRRVE